jgi:cyclophilin family peptidyl-prolyl cis-trans isomerase
VISRIVSAFCFKPKAASKPTFEQVEKRVLFAGPQVTSIKSDYRGEVQVTFNLPLDPATIKGNSVQVHTEGADHVWGTADDVKIDGIIRLKTGNRRVWFRPRVPVPFAAGTTYSFKISGKVAKGQNGERIDGEFNGAGITSGNGTAGGDLLLISKRAKTDQVARFYTVLGDIDVDLFATQTPQTYANFRHYADNGLWDYTFFHRSAVNPPPPQSDGSPFVIQGGGFAVDLTSTDIDSLTAIPTIASPQNEPGISNVRGTIAMAKLGPQSGHPDPANSATDQWFFNENDNSFLDSSNGGFTVFGQVKNASGLAVMDAIGALQRANLQGGDTNDPNNVSLAMDEAPVLTPGVTHDTVNTLTDLTIVRRVALLNRVSAFPFPT